VVWRVSEFNHRIVATIVRITTTIIITIIIIILVIVTMMERGFFVGRIDRDVLLGVGLEPPRHSVAEESTEDKSFKVWSERGEKRKREDEKSARRTRASRSGVIGERKEEEKRGEEQKRRSKPSRMSGRTLFMFRHSSDVNDDCGKDPRAGKWGEKMEGGDIYKSQ